VIEIAGEYRCDACGATRMFCKATSSISAKIGSAFHHHRIFAALRPLLTYASTVHHRAVEETEGGSILPYYFVGRSGMRRR